MIEKSKLAAGVMFLLPLVFFPGFPDEFRTPKVIAVITAGCFVFGYLLYSNIRKSLAYNYVWSVIASLLTGFGFFSVENSIRVSGQEVNVFFDGYGLQFQMASIAILTFSLLSSFLIMNSRRDDLRRVLFWIINAGLATSLIAYLQMLDLLNFLFVYKDKMDSTVPTGMLGNQTLLGPFLAATFTAAIFRRRYFSALFMLYPIYDCNSSFTTLSFLGGLSLWIIWQHGWKQMLKVSVVGLILLTPFYKKINYFDLFLDDKGRIEIWTSIIKNTVYNRPLTGLGLGTYQEYIVKMQSQESYVKNGIFKQAHNDYVEHFFETGLIGILLLVYLAYDLIMCVWTKRWNRELMAMAGMLLVFSLNALGNFPFRLVPQGIIALWAIVAIFTFKEEDEWHLT